MKMVHYLSLGKLKLHGAWQNGIFWYLLAILTLLPTWSEPQRLMDSVVKDTLFVIDISESMNVQDVDYPKPHTSRLTLAKLAVKESMASLPCGSLVSIALFAGEDAIVLFEPLEICRHFPAIEQVIARLNTQMRWIGDSWVVRALSSAIQEAEKRQLNLVMVTDADEMPHRATPRITDLIPHKGKVKGNLWGVGSEAPQPVPKLNGNGQTVAYWTPEEAVIQGNYPNLLAYVKNLPDGERAPEGALAEVGEHLSAFNKTLMQTIADTLQIPFSKINHPQDAINAMQDANLEKQKKAQRDARWLLGLTAVCFVLLGWFWQQIKAFKKTLLK
jgi:mxaL protein